MKKTVKALTAFGLAGVMATMSACAIMDTPQAASSAAGGQSEFVSLPYNTGNTGEWNPDMEFAMPSFLSFSGTVTEITPFYNPFEEGASPVEGMNFVLVENEDGDIVNFLVDFTTAVLVDGEIAEGTAITGYFDATMPVPMIWPPQHRAVAIMQDSGSHVLIDRFDDGFTSSNGINTLDITADTEIVFQDGQPFDGELEELIGRKLLVEFYEEGLVITPSRVTILFEIAVHPILELSPEEMAGLGLAMEISMGTPVFGTPGDIGISTGPALLSPEDIAIMLSNMFDMENGQIFVNGEAIEAPTPFINNEAATIMLPLAAIAEALGYTAIVDGNEVIIAPGTIVTEGLNSYSRGREMARELSSAPVVHDGVMFVPPEFFQEILSGAVMFMDGSVYVIPQ